MGINGKNIMLQTMSGKFCERIPTTLFCCGWEYRHKVAGLEHWQLSFGNHQVWQNAYRAMLDTHDADACMYDGVGSMVKSGELIGEENGQLKILDPNTGEVELIDRFSGYGKNHITGGWLGEVSSKDDIRKKATPHTISKEYIDHFAQLNEYAADRTLVMPTVNTAYWRAAWALGFERAMMCMMFEPELFFFLCDTFKEDEKTRYKQFKQAGAEAVFISDAWSSTDIMSPEMIRKFAIPYQKYSVDAIHELGMKVMLWNEGDVRDILADEAALEIDAFGVEQSRKNVHITMKDLRKHFGNDRCILGNLDSELLMMRNNPVEIKAEIERIIDEAGKGLPFSMFNGSPYPSNVDIDTVKYVFEVMGSI